MLFRSSLKCSKLSLLGRFYCNEREYGEDIRKEDEKRELTREYYRRYNLENKDKRAKLKRAYYVQNNDKRLDYDREHYARNKDNVREYNRKYYLENKDAIRKSTREYSMRNKDKESTQDYYNRNLISMKDSMRKYYVRNKDVPEDYSPRSLEFKSWKSPEEVREFFESVGEQLSIACLSDWYRISRTQMAALGGSYLYSKFESLGDALQYAYPEFDWDFSQFARRGKKAEQRRLKALIEELLPGVEVAEDFQHPELTWDNSNRHIELDLWIPKYRIGVEYQGEHHYYNKEGAFGPNGTASMYSERDVMKLALCKSDGITLIILPYWWDGAKESLSATLYQSRPDVFPMSDASPIPNELPSTSINPRNRTVWKEGE